MKLIVKNMVCPRCIMAVQNLCQELSLPYSQVRLGWVEFSNTLSEHQLSALSQSLQSLGFELVERQEQRLIVELRTAILSLVRSEKAPQSLSAELSSRLGLDYEYMSRTFSNIEGKTLESLYINQRIEYAKELLEYSELSIKEIAYKLHYSSVAHFSKQFKQVAGITASSYQALRLDQRERRALDKL